MPRPLLAFDPGMSGGFALDDGANPLVTGNMPDESGIVDLIRSFKATCKDGEVWVEDIPKFVGRVIPGAAVAVLFRNFGFIVGCAEGLGLRIRLVRPQAWQANLGLGTKVSAGSTTLWKNKLKGEAARRFPNAHVTLASADALLILDHARKNP